MTIHIAPITALSSYRWSDPKFTQHYRVYQMYRQANNPAATIREQDTFWCGQSFITAEAMEKALGDDKTLEYITSELKSEALEKQWQGMEVASTVVAFYPNWDKGYAIDNLDSRHLKRAFKHHQSDPKPGVGKKPHLAWNITKSEGWTQAVELNFQEKMQNLRSRTRHLENLVWHKDERICADFNKVATIWFEKSKGLERVGDFFLALLENKRFDAHRHCLEIWGQTIGMRPESLYYNLRVGLTAEQRLKRGETNPLITPQDSFTVLNTMFAMFPEACLSGKELLSDTWINGLSDPDKRDAAMVAILSGYARYQKKVGQFEYARHSYEDRRDGKSPTEESICIEFWRRLGYASGMGLKELLDHMGEFPEGGSKTVAAYVGHEIKATNQSMFADSYAQPIVLQSAKELSLRYVPEALDVLMKAKLLSLPAYNGHYVSRVEQDQDRTYFMRVINHPYATLEQIKGVMPYERFTRAEIEEMEAVDPQLAKDYIAGMKESQISEQISKNNIPAKYLTKGRHRDDLLGTDLGL